MRKTFVGRWDKRGVQIDAIEAADKSIVYKGHVWGNVDHGVRELGKLVGCKQSKQILVCKRQLTGLSFPGVSRSLKGWSAQTPSGMLLGPIFGRLAATTSKRAFKLNFMCVIIWKVVCLLEMKRFGKGGSRGISSINCAHLWRSNPVGLTNGHSPSQWGSLLHTEYGGARTNYCYIAVILPPPEHSANRKLSLSMKAVWQ